MTIQTFTHSPFQTNGYVAHAGSGDEAVLVDAPSHNEAERRAVLDYVREHDLTVRHLLLTHAHLDHIFGCAFFAEHFDLSWQLHAADAPLIERSEEQSAMFGVPLERSPAPDLSLEEGDEITFGERAWQVFRTPGHSPGSVSFFDAGAQVAFSGDVLFQQSVGRVDLPGGDGEELLRTIREKLVPLGDDVTVHPGHGPATTIGRERESNPFLTGAAALS
jgi:glyoxylase-like metal-dependent hydrolase (beta-lactamase superfamily II)